MCGVCFEVSRERVRRVGRSGPLLSPDEGVVGDGHESYWTIWNSLPAPVGLKLSYPRVRGSAGPVTSPRSTAVAKQQTPPAASCGSSLLNRRRRSGELSSLISTSITPVCCRVFCAACCGHSSYLESTAVVFFVPRRSLCCSFLHIAYIMYHMLSSSLRDEHTPRPEPTLSSRVGCAAGCMLATGRRSTLA